MSNVERVGDLLCPKCGHDGLEVIMTQVQNSKVRRRRECEACHHRFTTFEVTQDDLLEIGRRFPEVKIMLGIRDKGFSLDEMIKVASAK